MNKYQKTVECFKKAIEIDPESFQVYNNLGTAFISLHKLAEVIECFKKALEINPKSD